MAVDALGRTVELPAAPGRVVSLVPSLTEFVFAIGAGGRLAGVTEYCLEPAAQVSRLPKVRGTKNPDRAAILALQPELVLAAKEENRERDIEALAAAGLPIYVTDICSVADAVAQLGALASLLEAQERAAALLAELEQAADEARAAAAARPPRRTLAFIWRDPWMAIGRNTFAGDLLRICGADNLALQLPGRYPRARLEEFLRLDPEVILLPSEPYQFAEPDLQAFAPFSAAQAVAQQRIFLCDGQLLTWYGPRTAEALRVFTKLLY